MEHISLKTQEALDDIKGDLFELVEWRSMFYAFQKVDVKQQPLDIHSFFQQWKVGGVYAMYCCLAKLVSEDRQVNSLRKLWCDIEKHIKQSENQAEISYISELLADSSLGRFSNQGSQAMLFYNDVIAHNKKNIDVDLDNLDKDIRILIRIWSLITMWCASSTSFSWRENQQAFSALETFYTADELDKLKLKRQEYLDKVDLWGKKRLLIKENK